MEEKQPIRVLQVFASLGMGGAESRMMDVYRHIDKNRFSFDFVSMQDGKEYYEDEIQALGGKIIHIVSPTLRNMFSHIQQLRTVMRHGNYDAVHAHTSYHCGLVMLAAKLEHVSIRISHARTTGSKRQSKILKFLFVIGRMFIRCFSTERLAISQDAGKFLFGNSKFEILPNAIDTEKYQLTTLKEKNMLRCSFDLPENAFVIGQIGRFNSMKNHEFTLRWFEQYHHLNPDSFLVFIGDGELREKLEQLSMSLKIYDYVRFLGVRGDVPTIIHIMNVLIFPSVFEGLGGVVLEAQAAGIPVVESDSLPLETDMGLSLIERCSLTDDYDVWNDAINRSYEVGKPSYEKINESFNIFHYSLKYELEKLERIYKGD